MLPGVDLRNGHFVIAPNISEESFLAGLRKIRVIIARNNFRGINCIIISEQRVTYYPLKGTIFADGPAKQFHAPLETHGFTVNSVI